MNMSRFEDEDLFYEEEYVAAEDDEFDED